MRQLIRGVAFALALACPSLHACSICGCGDPLMSAGDSMPQAGHFSLGLDAEFLTAQAASDDNPDKTETLTQQTYRPVLVFSPTDALNVVIQVPIVNKDWGLSAADGDPAEGLNQWGVGDIDLGGRFFFLQRMNLEEKSRQSVSFSYGSTFPTGGDDAEVDGERIDQHAQLGTGAYGPYAGLLYAFHEDPWNVSVNAYGKTHSVNNYDYAFGSAITGGLQVQYRLFERLSLDLAFEGRYSEKDISGGVNQDNTGGTLLELAPGIRLNVAGGFWISAKVQIPVYANLFGTQSVGPTTLVSTKWDLF